ncbi:MAG: glycosyltransferase family 1 protein [Candidatus Moraniibacteriota bacterium]
MRIGINANYFQKPSTGIGVVTVEFMRALAETTEGKTHEWIWYYEGVIPEGVWPKYWRFQKVSTWWRRDDVLHRFLWERFALLKAIEQDGCDVFFSLYQSATILPEAIRHVMLVHDLIPKRFPEYLPNIRQRFHYRAVEKAIHLTTRIIVPSRATKQDLELFLAIPRVKIAVAPLGIAEIFRTPLARDDREAVLRRYELEPGYLYHGGGLELRKNTALLLKAYAKLIHSTDRKLVPLLVISGTVHAQSNPLATPVQALIAELGLASSVRLLGWVPDADLPALYQGARVFIYPSRYEGFGLPVLEAFASGTPVISTAAGSLAELVHDAVKIVTPDDVDDLARAILTLLTDEQQRLMLQSKGSEQAAVYSWPRFIQTVLSTLLQ